MAIYRGLGGPGDATGDATNQASLAINAANSAIASSNTATTQASISTAQAVIATTQASNASASATLAANYVVPSQTSNSGKFLATNGTITSWGSALTPANNLSDLTNITTARTNLALGSLATQSGTFSGTSSGTNTGDQSASTVANTPAGNIAATTVQAALNELDAEKAKIGTNSDITSLTGLTTPLSVAQGGTGLVSVGTSGNVLTSNGSAWTSTALPAGGVTSLNGQTGAITDTTLYAIGSYVIGRPKNITTYAVDSTIAGSSLWQVGTSFGYWNGTNFVNAYDSTTITSASLINTGTWRCMSSAYASGGGSFFGLWVRIS